MIAPAFIAGQLVTVAPPMTPHCRHSGRIIARARNGHGWRVEFDAWGIRCRETMPERCIAPA
jgi:hypothetical protein